MLEWIDVITTIALGLLLRFGIPLAVTGLLVWWLRRVDLQWQAKAEDAYRAPLNAALAWPPCWEVRNCPPELREKCAAYLQSGLPCWQVMRKTTGRLPERCFDCLVFRNAPVARPA
ncbi:MAG TPA: hypothetical protein VJ020_09625 [Anaerolineales bacterium]|nr:hypothetical protein [Anaerolineales bacterium]